MDQEQAIEYLRQAITEIPELKKSYRFSAIHTKWVATTSKLLEDVFGRASLLWFNFGNLSWEYLGSYISRGLNIQAELERKLH